MQLTNVLKRLKGFFKKTDLHVSRATKLAIASLFIVGFAVCGTQTAYAADPNYGVAENWNFYIQSTYINNAAGSGSANWGLILSPDMVDLCESPSSGQYETYYWNGTGWTNINGGTSSCTAVYGYNATANQALVDGRIYAIFYRSPFPGVGTVDETNADGYVSWTYTTADGLQPGNPSLQNLDYDTRFTDGVVSGSSSTTLQIKATYFLKLSEYTNLSRPDTVFVHVVNDQDPNFEKKQKVILPLADGSASTTILFDETYPDGSYGAQLMFYNINSQTFVWGRGSIFVNFTVSGGAVTSSAVVVQSDAVDYNQFLAEQPCGLTAISGCIVNAFSFIFVPSDASLDNFNLVYESMKTKVPFVYAFQAGTILTGMYTGSGSTTLPTISYTTGIGTITFISEAQLAAIPYVSLLRSLIGYGLWIMLFVALYRKTLTIHDAKTV